MCSGTAFILVMLFTLTDPDRVFSTDTGMAITELIYDAVNNRIAAVILTVMLAVCFMNGTMGCMTSGSRLLYSMARDKGMVFPSTYDTYNSPAYYRGPNTLNRFGRIHRKLEVPVETIILVQVFNLIFGLLYLGPTVAFGAYISSCTILLNLSCKQSYSLYHHNLTYF